MSHREGRDSDSKRHRSRFDREPSPKRSRRDRKPAPERLPGSKDFDIRNQKDEFPLESPLPADSKLESVSRIKESDREPNGEHKGKKHSSYPTEGPRSRSYIQHDERGNATQVDRSFSRGSTGERGWWRDSRDQRNRRTENKNETNDTWRRDDRDKGDEKGNLRHDKFLETEAETQSARKRPAFRERKIQVEDSGRAEKATTEIVKSTTHPLVHSVEESGKEERGRRGRYLDRPEKPFAGRDSNRREPQRAGLPSRERYHHDGGNYRGGDRFNGRPGFHSSGARVEKWKHDLYNESNRSPTPKNEEDQIAKLEALLSS